MKVVFFANYVPDPCGAFFHDVAIAQELKKRGHQVSFVAVRNIKGVRGVYRGIPWTLYTNAEGDMASAHVWSSPHFPIMPIVRRLNEQFQRPLVVTAHFGEDVASILPYSRYGEWAEFLFIVSNSITKNLKSRIPFSPTFKTIEAVRPIMIENEIKFNERGTLPSGEYITLINANLLKGLDIFCKMARKYPDRKFLGVKPYYNAVNVPALPNIDWIDIQDDIRNVLKRTRLLLVPSKYESWGRVAFEAMYNGIPVIYSSPMKPDNPHIKPSGSTEGLAEWIGDSQLSCPYDDENAWSSAIEQLDDPDTYKRHSELAYETTYNMNCFSDINKIEKQWMELAIQYAPKPSQSVSKKVDEINPTRMVMPQASAGFRAGRFVVRR